MSSLKHTSVRFLRKTAALLRKLQDLMAKPLLVTGFLVSIVILGSCATAPGNRTLPLSLQAGFSAGGLVENSSLEGVEGADTVDSITGATKTTFNAGLHCRFYPGGHEIETGLDYIGILQTVDFNLPTFSTQGSLEYRFHQLRLPVTWNLPLFRDGLDQPRLVLRAGLSLGYSLFLRLDQTGDIPAGWFRLWDAGPTAGVSFFPFSPIGGYRTGFYLDLYRGSRIYQDDFHLARGMGGQSFLKAGIVIQPPAPGL